MEDEKGYIWNGLSLNKIYNMDCIEGMKLIPDGSIDCIITDPPYQKKDLLIKRKSIQ